MERNESEAPNGEQGLTKGGEAINAELIDLVVVQKLFKVLRSNFARDVSIAGCGEMNDSDLTR